MDEELTRSEAMRVVVQDPALLVEMFILKQQAMKDLMAEKDRLNSLLASPERNPNAVKR